MDLPAGETGAAETPRRARPPGEYVLVGMPDVNGSLRGKAFQRDAFEAAVRDGAVMTDLLLALDPVDMPITDYESFGIRSGAGDLVIHPDVDTLRELAWRPGWSICLATPSWRDGRRCDLASREVLRNALAAMADLGYDVMAAFEYEVRLRDSEGEPLSSGISYSLAEIGRYEELVSSLAPALAALGVELDAIHTEAGPGLVELNLAARYGLRAADDAAFVKLAVKEVAASLGLRASFLAKTVAGEEGSSGHVHMSFWSDGANAFAPEEPGGALPAPAGAAVAGTLDHLAGASLLLNPTINSYKRLVPGWFAPVNATWGIENRSAAIRAISAARQERCRLECRRSGADANPYLALAALVVSAADGIRRDAEPPPPIEGDASERGDVPPLPGSLETALAAFRADATLRAGLGESFSDYYAISREWELRAWRESVSDWERERYDRAV
ncbi:MAG: glutamine synthetase [Thermoleophilia bacterium]|nr:glutamine synthetase [Thermoleophilia bacterium]